MMWSNYRRKTGVSVPSPFDGDKSVPWFYDKIATQAEHWANWAKTDILFPSSHKTNAGPYPGADGYGVWDDYDIGSKNTPQFGGIPTRFGYADQLRRAVAIVHANGMNALTDYVMHQRMGGKNGVYRYSAAGGPQAGRFPKDPPCFRGDPPRVPEDPVPAPSDDFSFGDELCPINAQPKNYVRDGLIAGADWLFRTCGFDGARIDDTKGLAVEFVKDFLASPSMRGKWLFGEFASGGTWSWSGGEGLENWLQSINHGMSATDFDFHYNMVMPMCNNGGAFFMGNLAHRGLIAVDPMHAVPFVESMDSDVNGFATVIFNKVQGYALLLTGEGLPQIYYRDWASEPDCYGLHERIDNLCWIAHHFSNGGTIPRVTHDPHVYVFERTGNPGLLVTLNNDVFDSGWKTTTAQTSFGPNVHLKDYTGGNTQDCWTNQFGVVTTGVPPAANGLGYGCWAPVGYDGKPIKKGEPRYTTQEFFGADDLDIPALTSEPLTVGRVWCDADKPVSIRMLNVNGQAADFRVYMQILGPDGHMLVQGHSDHVYGDTAARGWHTLVASGSGFGITERTPFILSATYMATQDLHESEFGL
jgi:alpha-amylase